MCMIVNKLPQKGLLSGFFTVGMTKAMRLTSVFLLLACLQVSAATYAQSVSISGKNMSLSKVFNKIRKQTGYNFIYADENLSEALTVSLHAENMPLREILDYCFAHQPLTYK